MMLPWANLNEQERAIFRAATVFLKDRLAEANTIDWALRLKHSQRIERVAVESLLNGPGDKILDEPWAAAWRLIEESWASGDAESDDGIAVFSIQKRLRAGDRSATLISALVKLVAPRLKVEPTDSIRWHFVKKPRRPNAVEHLLSANLTSGDLIDLNVLELPQISEVPFLVSLATALNAAVLNGLEIGRRLGWSDERSFLRLGFLNRVYYTQTKGREPEADAYHRGIAPATKLLHAVVERIANLRSDAALPFVRQWRSAPNPIGIRLWAAFARSAALVTGEEAGAFIVGLDDRRFWNLHSFPEIAELRALRFSDLDPDAQKAILKRLRRGPPRSHWPRTVDTAKVTNARLYWAVRELRRIEVAGGGLPPDVQRWMQANIGQFPDLVGMETDAGFPETTEAHAVPPNPDPRYDSLSGASRLRALETALSSSRGGWDDDPAERANDWILQPAKLTLVLADLESVADGGDEFPRVWNRFGWAHSPIQMKGVLPDPQNEVDRILSLLNQLSANTLSLAIEGISNWLDAWSKQVVASPLCLPVWLRVWRVAVEATNSKQESEDDVDKRVTLSAGEEDLETMDFDTLNTPAGKLVGVFLAACPSLAQEVNPFVIGSVARQMRDVVISAGGRSGLIAKLRLIEALPYFLRAEQAWAQEHLIAPLLNDDGSSLALWRAIARRTHFTEVLKIIGNAMAERATDRRLARETRRRLVFSLIIESMHAFRGNRDPAVPNARIQQMLRSMDDEVRASAAGAIQQFVGELSTKGQEVENPPSAADLFRSSAAPFLRHVWPQERSLATPGVSRAFADLPATSGAAFADAVDEIERFLVPFECWSLVDYGLYGEDNGKKKLSIIDSERKANALLTLLNLTVGTSEGSVVPHDLTDALDKIRSIAPHLADNPIFGRLATAARR